MKVFFDNCTSPVLADILDSLLSADRDGAHHIRGLPELGLDASTPDIAWMNALSSHSNEWVVSTGDDRIHRNRIERQAWLRAGLKGFVLARGYQKMPIHQQASNLLWRWPEMKRFIESAAKASLFELPVKRSAGFRSLV